MNVDEPKKGCDHDADGTMGRCDCGRMVSACFDCLAADLVLSCGECGTREAVKNLGGSLWLAREHAKLLKKVDAAESEVEELGGEIQDLKIERRITDDEGEDPLENRAVLTPQTMKELVSGDKPAFLLTSMGMVQLLEKSGKTGLLVATNHRAAMKLAAISKEKHGKKVAVCEVGSLGGETLADHIAKAVIDHGANGVFFSEDGENLQFFDAPPVPK